MIDFTPRAARQVRELRRHYERLERPEAVRGLMDALEAAWRQMTTKPETGLPAPRPYPQLARADQAWVKSGAYWICYSTAPPPVILAVFYETADIPGRFN